MRFVSANAIFLAWLIALAASLGALFTGEVRGQTPCQLCWYQRIAMFPLAVILGIGSFADDITVRRYGLPFAFTGIALALWHSLLYAGVITEALQPCSQNGPSCTGADQTLFGILSLPYLSLAAFAAIALLLLIRVRTH